MRIYLGLPAQQSISRRRLLIAPLSPVGLASLSYAFFIACVLFPPHLYEAVMGEPDWMFLDPASLVFVTLCVLGYMAGVVLIKATAFGRSGGARTRYLGRRAILLPLLIAFILNLISVLRLAKNTPTLFTAWLADGAAAKASLDATDALTQALPLLYGICWWVLWQVMNREQIGGRRSTGLRCALWIVFATALATAVIKVARYDLMPMVFGITLIYLTAKLSAKRISLLRYFAFGCAFASGVTLLFVLFSWLRGSDSQSVMLKNVMGYTIASYDRLAGVLDGKIRFLYGGTGTFAFRFLSTLPMLHRWVGFGMPDTVSVFRSTFSAVSASGLITNYNWASAFGYVYSDMGWIAPAYFSVVGALSEWAWRRLRANSAAGLLLYPWLAFSVAVWFSYDIVSSGQLVTLAAAGALLSIYERVVAKRARTRDTTDSTEAVVDRAFLRLGG